MSSRDKQPSWAQAVLAAAMTNAYPFSFDDIPDLDRLRGKSSSIIEVSLGSRPRSPLAVVAQFSLSKINKAAMSGHEVANQTMWLALKYWRANPQIESSVDFVAAWEEAGRPHTSLRELALMQQAQIARRSGE